MPGPSAEKTGPLPKALQSGNTTVCKTKVVEDLIKVPEERRERLEALRAAPVWMTHCDWFNQGAAADSLTPFREGILKLVTAAEWTHRKPFRNTQ